MNSSLKTRYVPVFKEMHDEYIFIRELGEGAQASAQLVLHLQSGEYRVRKAFNAMKPGKAATHEADILQILQVKASEVRSSPNVVTFHGSSPGVVYLGFCNGGDLSELSENTPASVIYRLVAQVTRTLVFMHQNGVAHNDLHSGNVFVHYPEDVSLPEFYIGDFGHSTFQDEPVSPPTSDPWFAMEMLDILQRGSQVSFGDSYVQELKALGAALSEEANSYNDHAPCESSAGFVNGNVASLRRMLNLAEQASAKNPMSIEDLQYLPRPDSPSITYFDSVEACMRSDIQLQGPFQMAEVRVDSNGVIQALARVDDEIHNLNLD